MLRRLVRMPTSVRQVAIGDRARRGAAMIPRGRCNLNGLRLEAATLPILSGSALIGCGACAPGAAQ